MSNDFNNPDDLTPMDEMSVGDLVNLDIGQDVRFEVLAVHGGWIYTRICTSLPPSTTSTFVPKPFLFKPSRN